MNEEQREIRRKKRVIEYAESNGNVNRACESYRENNPIQLIAPYTCLLKGHQRTQAQRKCVRGFIPSQPDGPARAWPPHVFLFDITPILGHDAKTRLYFLSQMSLTQREGSGGVLRLPSCCPPNPL